MHARRLALVSLLVFPLLAAIAPPTAAGPPCVPIPMVDDHCERWIVTHDHEPGHVSGGIDMAFDSTVSSDGSLLYVTGQSWDEDGAYDFATIAYSVSTGEKRWSARWGAEGHDIPYEMVLSPDGRTLYVHGSQHMDPVGEGADFATVAYDAATGDLLWASGYNGGPDNTGYGVAVSPDGEWVYATGKSGSNHSDVDFATVAYRADSGELAWTGRWSRLPGEGEDIGIGVVATNDAVYVGGAGVPKIVTLAYRAGDPAEDAGAGELLWESEQLPGYGYYIALSPDGKTVYTTGSAHIGMATLVPDWSFTTVAYDAATGARKWQGLWAAPEEGLDVPYGHAMSPHGSTIYVTGVSRGTAGELDQDGTTVAFNTTDGSVRWVKHHSVPGTLFEGTASAAVSPDGSRIFVTGWSINSFGTPRSEAVTIAYDAGGTQLWIARYQLDDAAPFRMAQGDSVNVTPDGQTVLTVGYGHDHTDSGDPLNQDPSYNSNDYLVISYGA
ncbi:MAG: PQQ-binding-like beta-propeller repeat protein [Actinomycetota bacterium]